MNNLIIIIILVVVLQFIDFFEHDVETGTEDIQAGNYGSIGTKIIFKYFNKNAYKLFKKEY